MGLAVHRVLVSRWVVSKNWKGKHSIWLLGLKLWFKISLDNGLAARALGAANRRRVLMSAELRPVHKLRTASLLAELWQNRSFLIFFAYHKVKASLSESRGAVAWLVLEPAAKMLVFGAMFGLILPQSSRPDNFVMSVIIGVVVFEIYALMSGEGTRFSRNSAALVEQTSVSAQALMVSKVVEVQVRSLFMMLVIFGAALMAGITPTATWLALPALIVGGSVFLFAVGLLVAALSTLFPSFPRLLGAFNKVVFFGSGIFWSLESALSGYPNLLTVATLNPVYQLVELCKAAVLGHQVNWLEAASTHLFITGLILAVGYPLFQWSRAKAYE